MDVGLLVTVNIMAFSAIALAFFLSRRDWNLVWSIAINLAILALGAAALAFGWRHPGWVTGIPFLLLVVAPAILVFASQRRNAAGDVAGAVKFMRWAAQIHPTPAMRLQARVTEAHALPDPVSRAAAFHEIAASASPSNRRMAEAHAWQALDRWDMVLQETAQPTAKEPGLAVMHLRALGECGETTRMVEAYHSLRAKLPMPERITAELFVLAFTGREKALAAMLDRKRSPYDEETRSFWKAIAAAHAGRGDAGALGDLARTARRGSTRLAAARHLDAGTRDVAGALSRDAKDVIDNLAQRTMRDAALASQPGLKSVATLMLLTAVAAMFAAELWYGGAEDLNALYNLGGLWPASVTQEGEWWRLGTALFLHFGWVHLAVNVFSLFIFGRAVEVRLGTLRMLVVFLMGGLLSSASVLALMRAGVIEEGLLVGASGAIMALFGAIIAYQVVSWRRSRDILDLRPLLAFLAIVVLQTVIDLSLPQVSLAAHLAGLAAGFAIALPLVALMPKPHQAR